MLNEDADLLQVQKSTSRNEITRRHPPDCPLGLWGAHLRGAGLYRMYYLLGKLPRTKWTLGDHLFVVRAERCEFVQNVALMMDVSTSALQKYERAGDPGGVYPPAEKLVRLCDYYKLDPAVIFAAIRNDRTGEGGT